jgi:hypothetical protein
VHLSKGFTESIFVVEIIFDDWVSLVFNDFLFMLLFWFCINSFSFWDKEKLVIILLFNELIIYSFFVKLFPYTFFKSDNNDEDSIVILIFFWSKLSLNLFIFSFIIEEFSSSLISLKRNLLYSFIFKFLFFKLLVSISFLILLLFFLT